MKCKHLSTEFVTVIGRDGRRQWYERCRECGDNVRGAGVWVQRGELVSRGIDPDVCPTARDLRSPEDRGEQRLLF